MQLGRFGACMFLNLREIAPGSACFSGFEGAISPLNLLPWMDRVRRDADTAVAADFTSA